MDIFSSFIYGLIQGITEFLPVSSSAHLALLPKFLEIKDPGITFDLMMHVGTALSVIVYFHKDLAQQMKVLFPALLHWQDKRREYIFMRNYSISLGATFLLAISLKGVAQEYGRDPVFIAINLALFGVLMYWFDRKRENKLDLNNSFNIKASLIIGFSQALAVFPGVSRSGITITAARSMGISRDLAFRYSFLLSLPVIFAAAILKVGEASLEGSFAIAPLLWGMSFSFVIGLLSIHLLMKLVSKTGLAVFAIYRIVLAIMLFYLF